MNQKKISVFYSKIVKYTMLLTINDPHLDKEYESYYNSCMEQRESGNKMVR